MTRTNHDEEIEAKGRELGEKALIAAPAILDHAMTIIATLAGLCSGAKVIAVQSVERPPEHRDNPAHGHTDHYVRVIDADDDLADAKPEGQA